MGWDLREVADRYSNQLFRELQDPRSLDPEHCEQAHRQHLFLSAAPRVLSAI